MIYIYIVGGASNKLVRGQVLIDALNELDMDTKKLLLVYVTRGTAHDNKWAPNEIRLNSH